VVLVVTLILFTSNSASLLISLTPYEGSGIPAGYVTQGPLVIETNKSSINIPNFDDVRQSEGFKNVSLGNVLSAKAPDEKIPFISEDDLVVYSKYRDSAFEV
jgi:hypothetical protein